MVELLDIPETITYSLSNVKLILVTNNYFVEINEVIKGLSILQLDSGCRTKNSKFFGKLKKNLEELGENSRKIPMLLILTYCWKYPAQYTGP